MQIVIIFSKDLMKSKKRPSYFEGLYAPSLERNSISLDKGYSIHDK